jgi:pentatricopeptide repeat protein
MENLYKEMLDKDVVPCSGIYDIMVEAYAKCGDESKVEALRKDMSNKGISIEYDTSVTNCELYTDVVSPV